MGPAGLERVSSADLEAYSVLFCRKSGGKVRTFSKRKLVALSESRKRTSNLQTTCLATSSCRLSKLVAGNSKLHKSSQILRN
jgi:hypothetical protein